jgi:hypothetical protein
MCRNHQQHTGQFMQSQYEHSGKGNVGKQNTNVNAESVRIHKQHVKTKHRGRKKTNLYQFMSFKFKCF